MYTHTYIYILYTLKMIVIYLQQINQQCITYFAFQFHKNMSYELNNNILSQ